MASFFCFYDAKVLQSTKISIIFLQVKVHQKFTMATTNKLSQLYKLFFDPHFPFRTIINKQASFPNVTFEKMKRCRCNISQTAITS